VHVLHTVYFWLHQSYETADKLTEEKHTFKWTAQAVAAFQTLQEALCTDHFLAYLQPRERFIVDTDASNVRIGGVLSQVQDDLQPIVFHCLLVARHSDIFIMATTNTIRLRRTMICDPVFELRESKTMEVYRTFASGLKMSIEGGRASMMRVLIGRVICVDVSEQVDQHI
jgi:hypothetical protein